MCPSESFRKDLVEHKKIKEKSFVLLPPPPCLATAAKFWMSLTEHFNLQCARMGLIIGIESGACVKTLVMQFVCIFDHQGSIRIDTLTSVIGQFVTICNWIHRVARSVVR